MDLTSLDGLFFTDPEPPMDRPSLSEDSPYPVEEGGIPFDEWHLRMTGKIFDDDRVRRGLRPMTEKYREQSLKNCLKSLAKENS